MDPWASVVIPTRDSSAWIGALLDHYRAGGFTPIILLDTRTRDGTRAIAERAGCPVVDTSGFTFTEAIVGKTRDCVRTHWALFMHDDEAPSAGLFARLRRQPPPDGATSVAIPRRWAWHVPGQRLAYGRSSAWSDRTGQPGADHQWRLFRPAAVEFVAKMHTEGFLVDRWSRLPPDSYFVHFEWVLRTHAQRVLKLRGYDRQRDGYGRFFENLYLPESQMEGVVEYLPFETHEYDRLAEAYFAARDPAVVSRKRGVRDSIVRTGSALDRLLRGERLNREPSDRTGLTPRLDRELPDSD